LDHEILRSIPHSVLCPKCAGNLDLSGIDADMTYECKYCGAEGVIEILREKK
jgi:hypothetical protein